MNEAIARTWAERAQAELGASRRFRDLFIRMQQWNVHPHILKRVEQAEEEEDLHAFLCAKMARKFGHKTGFSTPKGISTEDTFSWHRLREIDRLLLDVVLMGCITESLNASLLNSIYTNSGQTEAGKLIHRILKDEVQHAQIGWAYLAEQCTHRDCSFVSEYLVEMVERSINDELFLPITDSAEENSYQYGVMPQKERHNQCIMTLREVVCAGFEHAGIDTTSLRIWIENHSQPQAQ